MARTVTVEQLRQMGEEARWCPDGMRLGIRRFCRLFGPSATLTIAKVERWLAARTEEQRLHATVGLDVLLRAFRGQPCQEAFFRSTWDIYIKHLRNDPKARRELARAFCRVLREGAR